MQEFEGRVAVVTGAASGIGRALAERFAREGMKVVLADIEGPALDSAVQELRRDGHDAMGVRTDVAKAESVEELAQRTLEAYGAVHLVCNNAGVLSSAGPIWEAPLNDWHWVLGVNVWGVIHGMRTFVPIMLGQEEDGYMINTASIAGLGIGRSIYGISKHAVVTMTEALYLQLRARDARLGVSVLCPTFVNTRIIEAERNRPQELWNADGPAAVTGWEALAERLREAIPPAAMADIVVDAIRKEQLYILPPDYVEDDFRIWAGDLIERRNPQLRPSANLTRR